MTASQVVGYWIEHVTPDKWRTHLVGVNGKTGTLGYHATRPQAVRAVAYFQGLDHGRPSVPEMSPMTGDTVVDLAWRGHFTHESDDFIPVVIPSTGKAFHAPAQVGPNHLTPLSVRCSYRLSGERGIARDAIIDGRMPCKRCYPYDPIETWRITR